MPTVGVTIPEGLAFEALQLTRGPSGIAFDWAPIEAICECSDIDIGLLREQDEGNVAGLIIEWYALHCSLGGAPDTVAEELISEVLAEGDRDAASVLPSAGERQ